MEWKHFQSYQRDSHGCKMWSHHDLWWADSYGTEHPYSGQVGPEQRMIQATSSNGSRHLHFRQKNVIPLLLAEFWWQINRQKHGFYLFSFFFLLSSHLTSSKIMSKIQWQIFKNLANNFNSLCLKPTQMKTDKDLKIYMVSAVKVSWQQQSGKEVSL